MASAAKIEQAGNQDYQKEHMNQIFREGMSFSGFERDGLYLGLGDGRFRNISGVSGIDSVTDGRGSMFADFDNDGDLDVVVSTVQKIARLLYRNNVGQDNGFLRVSLRGTDSGADAFGAVVRLKTSLGIQTKIKSGGSGFLSSHDPRLLFGLGDRTEIQWLEVTWPAGGRQRITGIRPGESLLIEEGSGERREIAESRFSLVDPDVRDSAYRSLTFQRGDRIPPVSMRDLRGTSKELSAALKPGRRTLLNFWATWCVPCRHEMKELQQLWRRLEAAGVDLIGVSLDFDDASGVRSFLDEKAIDYPILIADETSLDGLLRGDEVSVPFTLLLDEDGTLLDAFTGWSRRTQEAIEGLAEGS